MSCQLVLWFARLQCWSRDIRRRSLMLSQSFPPTTPASTPASASTRVSNPWVYFTIHATDIPGKTTRGSSFYDEIRKATRTYGQLMLHLESFHRRNSALHSRPRYIHCLLFINNYIIDWFVFTTSLLLFWLPLDSVVRITSQLKSRELKDVLRYHIWSLCCTNDIFNDYFDDNHWMTNLQDDCRVVLWFRFITCLIIIQVWRSFGKSFQWRLDRDRPWSLWLGIQDHRDKKGVGIHPFFATQVWRNQEWLEHQTLRTGESKEELSPEEKYSVGDS